ncbi:MAG: hypothetical protein HC768_23770 [Acaryochloris sp. CRU_2_0]|nr:hypothetical protein [Acaryochloris sp. CRU_2_0]
MSNQEVQQGRELFTRNEQDEMLTALAQPLSQDRPIARLETGLEPGGRKTHRWYMNTKYQFVGIGGLMILVGLVGHHLIFGGQKSPDVVARENKTIQELRTKLKQRDDEDAAKTRENASLTKPLSLRPFRLQCPKTRTGNPLPLL